jgi:membrane associated rhomboid family serine protease
MSFGGTGRQGPGGFGGGGPGYRYRIGPGLTIPPVIKSLLLLNVGVFVLTPLAGWDVGELRHTFGLVPNVVFAKAHVWQLFTYMFLHAHLIHILFNMLMLWMFGSAVEHAWGGRSFLVYYFVCGLGGALTQWAVSIHSPVPVIGASGAVLGVILAYGLMYPNRTILLFLVLPIKMKYFLWILVAFDLWAGFSPGSNGVANFAHLGGMLFGYLYLKQDWRLGALGRKLRASRARMQMEQNARRAKEQQAELKKVDDILDKISEHGIDSLTEQERRILREASRH